MKHIIVSIIDIVLAFLDPNCFIYFFKLEEFSEIAQIAYLVVFILLGIGFTRTFFMRNTMMSKEMRTPFMIIFIFMGLGAFYSIKGEGVIYFSFGYGALLKCIAGMSLGYLIIMNYIYSIVLGAAILSVIILNSFLPRFSEEFLTLFNILLLIASVWSVWNMISRIQEINKVPTFLKARQTLIALTLFISIAFFIPLDELVNHYKSIREIDVWQQISFLFIQFSYLIGLVIGAGRGIIKRIQNFL